ncbi:MAG: hypothetical protein JWM16_3699 [Verrucomicrobiales bacterium]|nr:hypothetical protein [Verrucomicrobiales bacterium]
MKKQSLTMAQRLFAVILLAVSQAVAFSPGALAQNNSASKLNRPEKSYYTAAICVEKTIACLLPGNACSAFGETAVGVTTGDQESGFCFSITVSNCGSVTITNLSVVDSELGDITSRFFGVGDTLARGASVNRILKISLDQTTTNTVVASGRSSADGAYVKDKDYAVAIVVPASISCQAFVFSPDDVDGVPFDMHVQLPSDTLAHAIGFGIIVCNTGDADLTGVTLDVPGLAAFGCATTIPLFSLPAGACVTNTLCMTTLTCADLPLAITNVVEATVSPVGGCAYDIYGKPIRVWSDCQAVVECAPSAACRVTGGGRQESDKTFANPNNPALVGPQARYVTHGGQVGAPVGNETAFDPDSDCIHGNWTHVRHIQGGLRGNFHAKSFDSLMCACLSCPENPGSGVVINRICNPGDRTCGPEPRRAPANKICFSGVGNYALTSGGRVPRSVLFRVDIEDRSEPGNNKKASEQPSDRYRIRIWVLSAAELARLNNSADRLLDFRRALACTPGSTATRDGADVPNGTAVFGVRAPDIDDGGEMDHGNHQIHPQIKECP